MRCYKLLIVFILLIVFAGCRNTIEVTTEHEPGFTLNDYETFRFVTEDTSNENQVVWRYISEINLIKENLREELEERGLTYDENNPDLRVNIGIVVDERVQTRSTNIQTDPPQYIGQRRYTWRVREVEVGRYHEGTLTVHLVDNEKNELVWMGVGEAVIPKNKEKQERQIKEGIKEIASRIP